MVEKLDIKESVKIPTSFPWEYEDKSVQEISVIGVLEFIPGNLRGKFMDELYRILSDDGKVIILVPYWSSARAYQDYRTEWPPFCEQSFLYFNKGFRDANQLIDTGLTCDFDFTYGYAFDVEANARSMDSKPFWVKRYTNTVDCLQINLTKVKHA